jgi:hypothetical protein
MQCQDNCLAEASPAAFNESALLLSCIVDNGCIDEPCIDEYCAAETFECYSGDNTCLDVTNCLGNCDGDQVCEAVCEYESSPLAQAQFAQLDACGLSHNCNDDACLAQFCGDEFTACVGGGSDGLSCKLLVTCLIDCHYDEICALSCAPPMSPEAQAEADELGACAELAMCDVFACTAESCADQWGVCMSGEDSCAQIYACIDACDGAPICETNCLHEGSFPEQDVLFDLQDCIGNNDCVDQDQQCIETYCAPQAMQCGII